MTGGVSTALGEALDEVEGLPDREDLVQATLFGDDDPPGRADVPSPLSATLVKKSKGGRTPGAKNVRTKAVADWLLSMHRHPLAVMAEAYSMAPVDFLKSAGFAHDAGTPEAPCYSNDLIMEAVKLQFRMAEAVVPYVASKQPLAVQLSGKAGLAISFAGVSLPARGQAAEIPEAVEGTARVVGGVRLPLRSDDEVGPDA